LESAKSLDRNCRYANVQFDLLVEYLQRGENLDGFLEDLPSDVTKEQAIMALETARKIVYEYLSSEQEAQ
jgi:hypothetical protein